MNEQEVRKEYCNCDRTLGYSITGRMENGRCVKCVCNICGKETENKSLEPKNENMPHNDIKDHDNMSMMKIAEHLGVDLWKAMEIARWTTLRPKVNEPKEELK